MKIKGYFIAVILICYSSIAKEWYALSVRSGIEPNISEKFEAVWQSLEQFEVPGWLKDVKSAIWEHWDPQCQTEQCDWYARYVSKEGNDQYKWYFANYGHPSKAGFKEVIHQRNPKNYDHDKTRRKQFTYSLLIEKQKIIPNDIEAVFKMISELRSG